MDHTGRSGEGDARDMSAADYKYQAYDAEGKVQTGQVNAESEREALKILQG